MVDLRGKYAQVKDIFAKSKIKPTDLVRAVIYVICCSAMFFQVTSMISEYYEFKTVVQIRITNEDKRNMPAISVCKQMKATEYLEMLKNGDPEFGDMFPRKERSAAMDNKIDLNTTEEMEEDRQWDALANISHYFELDGRDSESFFRIVKDVLRVECFDVRTGTAKECYLSADPINSLSQRRICVTYFSKLYINFNFSENNFNISENETEKEEQKESIFAYLSVSDSCFQLFFRKKFFY